jgi:ribosomal protein S18 acetylase RimI-like enzyme
MPSWAPRIRRAKADDLGAITDLCKSSIRVTYGPFVAEDRIKPWVEGDETDKYVSSMLSGMLVAVADSEIVGVVAIAGATIDLVWVAPAKRGRGIGAALMTAAEKQIRADGHSIARLEVFASNREAIRFYEAHGWTRQDVYPDPVSGVDKARMEKKLPSGSNGFQAPM